jgi:PBP1b-binding outer membrane lipoprotein LpoB
MNNNNLKRLRALATCSALTLILSAGCGKEEAPPEAAAPVESAPAAAPDPAPQPVYAQPAPVDDVQAQMQQIDTRMQNQDYEGAVDAILRAQIAAQQQQAMISDQQRLDYHNRMRNVQKQIADAMASGDPNAERAARLLMQYNAARTQGR